MFSEEVKTIAQKIGQFYLEKNDSDYAKAHDEIRGLGITSIEVEGEIVTIRANRIGYLIGNKGKNINNLIAYLDKKIKLVEEKESLLDYLLPEIPDKDFWTV